MNKKQSEIIAIINKNKKMTGLQIGETLYGKDTPITYVYPTLTALVKEGILIKSNTRPVIYEINSDKNNNKSIAIDIEKSDLYALYIHTCIANDKVYIGITSKDSKDRWKEGEGYKSNFELYSDIRQYGWKDGFYHKIIADDLTWEEAQEKEKQLIAIYSSMIPEKGYNHHEGGRYGRRKESLILVGDKLKNLRKIKKMTQFDLATALQVTRATISNYESNRRLPSLADLQRFANYFGVGLDYFGLEGNMSNEITTRIREYFKSEEIDINDKRKVYDYIMMAYVKWVISDAIK